MSGPLRDSWTFPKRPEVLIAALEQKRAKLVSLIDEQLDGEALAERELNEYRERLRVAGVEGWDRAFPPTDNQRISDIYAPFRRKYQGYARDLNELDLFLAALREDQARDPNRLYKLHRDDLAWFELAVTEAQ